MLKELEAVPERTTSFKRAQPALRCEVIPYLLSTADSLTILLASACAGYFYHWIAEIAVPDLTGYFSLGLIASVIYVVRLGGGGHYDFEQAAKPGVEILAIAFCWSTTALLLAFLAFLFKIGVSFSRGSILMFIGIAPMGLLAIRKLEKQLLKAAVIRGAIGRRNVVVVGEQAEMASLEARDLLALFGAGEVIRFPLSQVTDPLSQQSSDAVTLNAVAHFVRNNNSSEVLLAVPWHDTARIDFIREHIKFLPVWVRLLPDTQIRALTDYASSARQQILSIEVQRAPLRLTERAMKRGIDLALGLVALVLFSPIMGFVAIGVKLSGRGPIIFKQHRKGFNGRQFVMFKFRTMTVLESGKDDQSVTQSTPNDPRVTTIGKLLRAFSIDELPQLLNVVRGEMSLIGPRPHALAHDNYFEKKLEDYAFRHHVKPGMTGWAQVNGLRGATLSIEMISRRVKMDLWYINNWSLWLDLQIVIKTFFELLRKRNAY
jgi:undecaprenyl-phosphate galactose phosphotransferase/putative colanic acid biosynthesis UDP-glucose lipid carrier transferase